MIRLMGGLLALLALTPALTAKDKPYTPTPAAEYEALVAEYDRSVADYRKALSAAKTPQERQKVMREKSPQPNAYAARFLAVAEKSPKAPIAVDALVWVVRHTSPRGKAEGNPCAKALTILTRDHIGSDKLKAPGLFESMGFAVDEASVKFVETVAKKSPDRAIRGKACLALAQQAEYRIRLAETIKDDPKRAKMYEPGFGKKLVEELSKADPEKLYKEAAACYERLLKDYGDLPAGRSGTMKELAKGKVEALKHPVLVGKRVPEIEGEDIDGKKFKLSDYRGKVVLLDFWGNW